MTDKTNAEIQRESSNAQKFDALETQHPRLISSAQTWRTDAESLHANYVANGELNKAAELEALMSKMATDLAAVARTIESYLTANATSR